jgi:hypothetical protein
MSMKNEDEFNLLEEIRKKEKIENPYQRFCLTSNPFPKSAIADLASESFFSGCRKNALARIKEFLVYAYKSQRWAGLIVKGEYGSGKSHLLYFVTNEVNRQLGTLSKDRALTIYIESPKNSVNDLYEDFIKKLGREYFENQVANVIGETIEEVFKDKPRQYLLLPLEKETSMDLISRLRALGKGLNLSVKNDGYNDLAKRLSSAGFVQQQDFAKCLGILLCDDSQETRDAAWKFCIGESLSKSEAKELRLVSESLSEDEIVRYAFPSVIGILNKNGIAMIFLLVDELEKIAARPRPKAFEFLENLRSLVDNNLEHLAMIFACVTEAWDVLSSISPGLSERMSEVADLDPLDNPDAGVLIKDYLRKTRITSYSGEDLFPFGEDAVEEINRFSRGSIRFILQNCYLVLERAASNKSIKDRINAEFAGKVLKG